MPECSVTDLKLLTAEFFRRHWLRGKGELPTPEWSEAWRLLGSVPGFDQQGIYAFLEGETVTYIGSGISNGSGRYKGHGIGIRTKRYMKVVREGEYRLVDARFLDAHLITLVFPSDFVYLAVALECFLFGQMATAHNKNRPGTKRSALPTQSSRHRH